MGALLALFAVADAMVLHGIAQGASNGFRVLLHAAHIQWQAIIYFIAGALLALLVLVWLNVVLDKAYIFMMLGAIAIFAVVMPKGWQLDISRPQDALICGVSTTAIHLIAGVVGPVLDVFYLRARLNRYQILATKALMQTLGHIVKIIYFSSLIAADRAIYSIWVYAMIIMLAFGGAFFGRMILDRLSEKDFRTGMRILLSLIGSAYLIWGLYLLEDKIGN